MEIYLDNSATTRVCLPAARAAYEVMTESYGNPSAVHSVGVTAKKVLENARATVAKSLNASPEEIYFSHSGTLANNTAVFGAVSQRSRYGKRIVTTALEHPSIARCMDRLEQQGYEVIRLMPDANGVFTAGDLLNAVNEHTILVSTMLVNNEIGAVNPVELISRAVKRANAPALIHVDAIQGYGKLPIRPAGMGIDLLTVSGHKIHAPKGVGALYIRKGVQIKPYVVGGGQENGLFSGTESLPAIAGLAAAIEDEGSITAHLTRVTALRNRLVTGLCQIPCVAINSPANALPYIVNCSVQGIPSQVMINYLSGKGIYVSAGSACKKGHRSEVLTKLNLPPQRIDSAIRISLSRFTTEEEIDGFIAAVGQGVKEIRTK